MVDYLKLEKEYLAGNSTDCYKFLGCHVDNAGNSVSFCVYAPGALSVTVACELNGWGGSDNKMFRMEKDALGFFHLKTDKLEASQTYKYKIEGKDGNTYYRADPFGFKNEIRPNTATVIRPDDNYIFNDSKWYLDKQNINYFTSPVNIYELHLGSWKRGEIPGLTPLESENCKADEPWLNYREIADKLVPYVKEMGYTHVELMPVAEHPLDESWGYQTLCFYSITSRYGDGADLKYFVDICHQNNIGVIFDWVPGHFCKDEPGLYKFDGTYLYESNTFALRENIQWGTANFDFSKGHVVSFLISNAMYYFKEYHVDGLRVDAVTNMLCTDYAKERCKELLNKNGEYKNLEGIEFLQRLNETIYKNNINPLMIAEESTAWPNVTKPRDVGGLGFTFKWNMGWMNDTLEYISKDPIYRQYDHNKMTFSIMYAFAENYILPISHDEVVHGKKSLLDKCFGSYDEKFKELRCYFTYMLGHPGKKLSFMGNEFGPFMEWRFYEELEWKLLLYPNHSKLREYVKKLNHLYLQETALYENDDSYAGFEWLNADDNQNNTYTFVRKGKSPEDFLIFVMNFSPCEHKNYLIGLPRVCDYEVLLTSDEESKQGVLLSPKPANVAGKRFGVSYDLKPYEAIVLKPRFR